ncbi:TIGR02281 family clan AA aspartic protease [Sphingomonas sp. So64.6b]|uniref:retropepsin-like aspartic protease family protein n=1 Tax=Sphingomonas sp. So64.6b TaxID=2997354 RepID=UPI001601150B|nr:TIGR02281 family clan AA aspartic protease [Sphingomonas sp. So64.6b]QNA83914.1 TIGR02281 family clan AA aspartic protease [Sphingomonas sp. So64.6b]
MTSGQSASVIFSILCLVLAVSALGGRRIPLNFAIKSALAWAAIIGIVYILVANRVAIVNGFGAVEHWASLGKQQTDGKTIRIAQSDDGHYYARVTINGVSRSMLIDSGATTIALSEATANAAGVVFDKSGDPVQLETANGIVDAWRAKIKQLDIDGLRTKDIMAVVSPNFGEMDVIGMNFLSRLRSWRVENGALVLEPMETGGTTDTDSDLT